MFNDQGYEALARKKLAEEGKKRPSAAKLARKLSNMFKPDLEALIMKTIEDCKEKKGGDVQPDDWVEPLEIAILEKFA